MDVSISTLDGQALGLLATQVSTMQRQESQRQLNPQGVVWAPVPEYPGFDVSHDGQLRSWWQENAADEPLDEPRVLDKTYDAKGYLWYVLHRFMRVVHVPERHQPTVPPAIDPMQAWAIVRRRHRVHRLMLAAFDRPPEPGEHAKFIDEDVSNVRLDNLRWARPEEAFR